MEHEQFEDHPPPPEWDFGTSAKDTCHHDLWCGLKQDYLERLDLETGKCLQGKNFDLVGVHLELDSEQAKLGCRRILSCRH